MMGKHLSTVLPFLGYVKVISSYFVPHFFAIGMAEKMNYLLGNLPFIGGKGGSSCCVVCFNDRGNFDRTILN